MRIPHSPPEARRQRAGGARGAKSSEARRAPTLRALRARVVSDFERGPGRAPLAPPRSARIRFGLQHDEKRLMSLSLFLLLLLSPQQTPPPPNPGDDRPLFGGVPSGPATGEVPDPTFLD